jgi:uncharacterized protein involved in exopolysaccharide biosynthesis
MPAYVTDGFQSQGSVQNEISQFKTELDTLKNKKSSLDAYISTNLQTDLNQASQTFSQYVTSCGTEAGPTYDKLAAIKNKLVEYNNQVTTPLSRLRQRVLTALNVNNQTAVLTNKYKELEDLKKELDELDASLSTAHTREAVIDTRDDAVSMRQTWGYLNRPLRRYSIPILIVFSLIFAAAGIYGISTMVATPDAMTSPVRQIIALTALIVVVVVTILKLTKQI